MSKITAKDLKVLTQWDTPTICNALEVTDPHRRGWGFTTSPFAVLDPSLPPMVGFARTLTIRAAQPDLSPGDKTMAVRIPYYEYVAKGPGPTIVVIEDLDPKPGVGAFWGEVHTAVHKGLGALGCVTNGAFRDLDDSAPGFQILGGMVNPSHAFVHPVAFGGPVTVHGMRVAHGDVIHADKHGAVVIPRETVKKIPETVAFMVRKEAVILDAARAKGFDIKKLKKAIGDQGDIH